MTTVPHNITFKRIPKLPNRELLELSKLILPLREGRMGRYIPLCVIDATNLTTPIIDIRAPHILEPIIGWEWMGRTMISYAGAYPTYSEVVSQLRYQVAPGHFKYIMGFSVGNVGTEASNQFRLSTGVNYCAPCTIDVFGRFVPMEGHHIRAQDALRHAWMNDPEWLRRREERKVFSYENQIYRRITHRGLVEF